jgi:hypothetical protein
MQNPLKLFIIITCFFGFIIASSVRPAMCQSMPALPANQLILPSGPYSIPFTWLGDTVNGVWEPHVALLIPVKLKKCPKLFYMQFDLGSPYSLFYGNKLAAIRTRYPKALRQHHSSGKLNNFSFSLGKMPVSAKEIVVKEFDQSGINWKNKARLEIIGTIGSDVIDAKVLVIDYPAEKLVIGGDIPAELQPKLMLTDFLYARRSIILPATLQGKKTMLYFDTGSSMYPLLTDKTTAETLALPNTPLLHGKVRSWDTFRIANSLATSASIEIANVKVPLRFTTYIEGVSDSQVAQMMKMGIGGMTGNKLLLDYILVIDTANKKFGLTK